MFTKPLSIGSLTLKNRFVMSAMATGFLELNGRPNERYIKYLERRAQGDVAMIVLESTGVLENFRYNVRTPSIANDADIPSWKKLTDRIHQYDCYVCLQLQHPGKQVYDTTVGEVVSSSTLPQKVTGVVAKALSEEEIQEYVEAFGKAAERAKNANFDAIEIHAGHGYLFSQFLSTYSNDRQDKYGGTLENRFRFLKEVIESVQFYVGKEFPLLVRMGFTEFVEGGMPYEETIQVAKWLEDMGIASIRVSGGNVDQSEPIMIPPTDVRKGIFWEFSKLAKNDLNIPVDAVGRIQSIKEAEKLLVNGYADYISIGRPLLADPDYVKKAISGRDNEIRPCIACNQGCIDRLLDPQIGEISCLMNYEVGKEGELLLERKTEQPKKVLIVGGGPAGMEAARVSAIKGHSVTLVEKQDKLGGTFNLAAIPPGKEDFKGLLSYFPTELQRLGVEVILNKVLSEQEINELKPDVLIWAVGASKSLPNVDIDVPIISTEEIFMNRPEKSKNIVFYGAKWESVETALLLSKEGYQVAILEEDPKIGSLISQVTRRWYLKNKLKDANVPIFENVSNVKFENGSCNFEVNGKSQEVKCDLVAFEPVKTAKKPLSNISSSINQIVIGDAKEPRNALFAVRDGFEGALQIEKETMK